MGCIGVNEKANTDPNIKMKAIEAELAALLASCVNLAAAPATIARQTDIPRQEPISILRLPARSWQRAAESQLADTVISLYQVV
jgi:hypothetical protein